jgi:hypothetical protein
MLDVEDKIKFMDDKNKELSINNFLVLFTTLGLLPY